MATLIRYCVSTLGVAFLLLACDGPATDEKRSERLNERLTAFTAAFGASDVEALDGLLAEHYSHTNNSSAPLERSAWLQSMARRRDAVSSGSTGRSQFSNSDVKVRISDDTAVVTGLSTMRGERDGKPFGMKIRYTHVWAWDKGDWYRVAFQDTYEPLTD